MQVYVCFPSQDTTELLLVNHCSQLVTWSDFCPGSRYAFCMHMCVLPRFAKLKPSKLVVTINNLSADLFIHQTFSAKCLKRVNFPTILNKLSLVLNVSFERVNFIDYIMCMHIFTCIFMHHWHLNNSYNKHASSPLCIHVSLYVDTWSKIHK